MTPEIANTCLMVSKAFLSPKSFDRNDPVSLRENAEKIDHKAVRMFALSLADEWERVWNDFDEIQRAYAKLFLGPFEIQAPPYASYYLEPTKQLMGEISAWVSEKYAEAGLEPGVAPTELPDHISLEFEYLYYVLFNYISKEDKHWLDSYSTFLKQHMDQWVDSFAAQIDNANSHPFYKVLGQLSVEIVSTQTHICN